MKYITLNFKCGGKVKLPANIFKSINLPEYLIENNENNGSNVELITLNATKNKTYNAPNNKAYNKVIVDVDIANQLIKKSFYNLAYSLTGKIVYYDPERESDNSGDYIPTLYAFNSSTNRISYKLPEEEEDMSINNLSGWYIVEGKALLDTIISHITPEPIPELTESGEEDGEYIIEIATSSDGDIIIDIIILCPKKIDNKEIYLIHTYKYGEEGEEPYEPEPEEPSPGDEEEETLHRVGRNIAYNSIYAYISGNTLQEDIEVYNGNGGYAPNGSYELLLDDGVDIDVELEEEEVITSFIVSNGVISNFVIVQNIEEQSEEPLPEEPEPTEEE